MTTPIFGSAFFVDGGGHQFARLAFSGITPAQIAEGVDRLERAVSTCATAAL